MSSNFGLLEGQTGGCVDQKTDPGGLVLKFELELLTCCGARGRRRDRLHASAVAPTWVVRWSGLTVTSLFEDHHQSCVDVGGVE